MRQAAAQIFLVGNDPELLATLSELLRADDIAIRLAPSGDGIFEMLRDQPPELILLDVAEMELLQELKEVPATQTDSRHCVHRRECPGGEDPRV